jgi:adenosylmethionine-8-amino-7-oxononanoate aminotransferase
LICDEVATGFGRTGTLFASERCGLRPDILTIGKGLTGGYLPLAASVASQRVYDAFLGEDLGPRTFYHGHSYSGNALGAAVALRHLELIRERSVLANVNERSAQLRTLLDERIAPMPGIAEVRLCGLMGGVEIEPGPAGSRRGRKICAAATRNGVLLRPLGDVVVLMPPLSVTAEEIETIVNALEESLSEVIS